MVQSCGFVRIESGSRRRSNGSVHELTAEKSWRDRRTGWLARSLDWLVGKRCLLWRKAKLTAQEALRQCCFVHLYSLLLRLRAAAVLQEYIESCSVYIYSRCAPRIHRVLQRIKIYSRCAPRSGALQPRRASHAVSARIRGTRYRVQGTGYRVQGTHRNGRLHALRAWHRQRRLSPNPSLRFCGPAPDNIPTSPDSNFRQMWIGRRARAKAPTRSKASAMLCR